MRSWPAPPVPALHVSGPEVSVHDTSSGAPAVFGGDAEARLYVCGITPYDATHLGHAATFVAFDLLNRAWRNAGRRVRYVQNVTDVDDPLLERANRDGIDWAVLAAREIELFREDMAVLRVLPPDHYVGVVEALPLVVGEIERLVAAGATYSVDGDIYYAVSSADGFGDVSRMPRDEMLQVFPQRGGDPDRPGKRDALDPLLWRAARPGEPSWESPWGAGRPGWHIECSAIAGQYLGPEFDVQGGGSDLIFPHHEMSAAHAITVRSGAPFARAYVHAGMVAYKGEKMSKSLGNLVFVSRLVASGTDPMAVRLALAGQHYRSDWEWTDDALDQAARRLEAWRTAVRAGAGAPAGAAIVELLARLADDLDAPGAVAIVQEWADATLRGDRSDPGAGDAMRAAVDAALGIAL